MPTSLEYHKAVRLSISAPAALLALLTLPVCLQAQINGVPSSVTSQGFGGHSANAPRASVTSLGPNGYAPHSQATFSQSDISRRGTDHPHHRHYASGYTSYYPYYYPYAIGIPVPATDEAIDDNSADDEANYQGGPTIFDRHGSGADSYIPPVKDAPAAHQQVADDTPAQPEPKQDPTLLVFTDGRKLEVGNYAIVGSTLYDLTPGHPRKIALSDLDLDATRKLNDDRGIVFQFPINPQAN
jgi:hypothetical protein